MSETQTDTTAERDLVEDHQSGSGFSGTVPLAVGRWYDFHELGWHLGNVG